MNSNYRSLGLYDHGFSSTFRQELPGEMHSFSGDRVVTEKTIPRGHIDFEENSRNREQVLSFLNRYGEEGYPDHMKSPFKEHYILFKTKLDLWWGIPIKKCLTREEIIVGSLTQGPAFAEWLKKARFFSYAAKVAEGNNYMPEEYILEGYEGYDSLFRESDLIHWTEETQDVSYSFIPVKEIDVEPFRKAVNEFLDDILPKCEFSEQINTLDWIKPSRSYDPVTGKSIPLRDGLRNLTEVREGYLGKRTVIQPFPAGIRDTAMADPDTIAKVRLCHELFSEMTKHDRHSAMSPNASRNLDRVLERKLFYHLDFKKVGLTFPRIFFVIFGDEMKKRGYDVWFLQDLEDIYLDIDGQTFRTERGYCLGWLNEGLTVLVSIFLNMFLKEHNLTSDYIIFNDDVLMGLQDSDPEVFNDLMRYALIEFFFRHDIFLSDRKCYLSKNAQFLEEYHIFDKENVVNMEKRQIGSSLFAKSLNAHYAWEAKMYASIGYEYYANDYVLEMCTRRTYEYSKREYLMPYESGGWVSSFSDGLNTALDQEWCLGNLLELREVKVREIAEKMKPFSERTAFHKKQWKIANASRIYQKGDEVFNFVREYTLKDIAPLIRTRVQQYSGTKKLFPKIIDAIFERMESNYWEPP